MKIQFDNVDFSSRTGPNTFGTRLAKKLFELGHEVTSEPDGADISLVFIERSGKKLTNKVIQRLDGIWFKPNEFHHNNARIRALYDAADAIVWQSQFDRKMTTKWFGSRQGVVIHNGIELNKVEQITIGTLASLRQTYDLMFVCSSNWHPQKRFFDNVRCFQHIREATGKKCCLIVLGNNAPKLKQMDVDIFYAGNVDHDTCLQTYAVSNWMIHLAWLDHCPNVVVEAISQGTPVIHSSSGGTNELVGFYGVMLNETEKYDFTLEDYDAPPNIDVTQLNVDRLNNITQLAMIESQCRVDINNIVKQYISLFEGVLNGK